MKNLNYILFLFTIISCKSQTIMNIDGARQSYGQAGYYYKDMNNIFDQFVGNYKYTNGTNSFTIKLEKMIHSSVNGIYYEDVIIGSYKYVENGAVKVDVLNYLNNNFTNGKKHVIYGHNILTGTEVGCDDCTPTEKRIWGSIKDPVSGSIDRIFIRKTTVNGQEAIKIFILHSPTIRAYGTPPPPPVSYPTSQDIILLKQS